MIGSLLRVGGLSSSSSVGGSVAKARAEKLSIMTLIHSIWIALIGDSLMMKPQVMAIAIAVKLTVSWNFMNFLIESKMFLPFC